MNEVSILLAFAAGLCSFLSPCCLPLIPSYLSFIGGTGMRNDSNYKKHLVVRTASFVLGFTAVFIVLSIILATTFSVFRGISTYINLAAGIIVIVIGINIFFDWYRKGAYPDTSGVCVGCEDTYTKRYNSKKPPENIIGAFLVGAAFAIGWTPCVGPVLGSILFLAGQSGSLTSAVFYLFANSMGLGLPFLCIAIFFDKALGYAAKTAKYKIAIQKISGILLVAIGLLISVGRFQMLNIIIQKWQYRFIDWAATDSLMVRLLPSGIAIIIIIVIISIRMIARKSIFCMKIILPCAIFMLIALLQLLGIIDSAGILSHWFLSLQNL
ncbi:MAG: hypothetical protein Ta2G_10730 [Termitinemataceae bacterium]|nr:MAG: hypothetical protein Ta2G_10730 [Termitinemataceae bacterium]